MQKKYFAKLEQELPKDIFYSYSQVVREYGQSYEHFIRNSLLVKDEATFKKYKSSNLITIETLNGKKSVSKDLLLDLISYEGLYKYLITNMDNEFSLAARIDYFENGDIKDSIIINRAELSIFLLKLNMGELNTQQKIRISTLCNFTKLNSLEKKFQNDEHIAVVDGEVVSIKVSDLLKVLTMKEEEFTQFVYGKNPFAYSKEIVVYMLNDFIKRNRIMEKYHLDEYIIKRYKDLEAQSIIDYESINKNLKANDDDLEGNSLIEQITINEQLYEEVFKYHKNTYSSLETAMYVYIRLCELLTYDQGYYASPKTDDVNKLEDVNNISLTNNAVTNYEFLLLYTALLREMKIRYTLDNRLLGGNADKASITFRSGEYLVKVDTLSDVLNSDFTNAKINAPLTGLICLNQNQISKQKFEELFYKIIKELIETKKERILFEGSLQEYHNKYARTDLSFKDKFYVLLKDIARPNLKGIDAIAYQKKVFENLFGNDDRISINFISSMINNYKDYTYTPLTIITLKTNDEVRYYMIDPNHQNIVERISESELEEYFLSGEYAYLDEVDEIPELELVSGVKYVR